MNCKLGRIKSNFLHKLLKLEVILVVVFVLSSSANAVITFERSYYWEVKGYTGMSVLQTPDEGYVITGEGTSSGAFLAKTDSLGDIIWAQTYGNSGTGRAVIQTRDNGYIITGEASRDVCLIKTDSLGNMRWLQTYGGDGYDKGYSVIQTNDGGYMISGHTYNNRTKFYLIRTDSVGDTIWTRAYNDSLCKKYGVSMVETIDGGYIIVGSNTDAICEIKVDSLGDLIWSKKIRIKQYNVATSIAQTKDSCYIITGYVRNECYGEEICLIKIDSLGDTIWTRTYPPEWVADLGHCVIQARDGGYLIAGQSGAHMYFRFKVYLIKTDSMGDTIWTRKFECDSCYFYYEPRWDTCTSNMGYSVKQTTDGGYIITGMAGAWEEGFVYRTVYLIKTDSSGCVYGVEEEPKTESRKLKLEVWPNPFIQSTIVRFEDSRLQIKDCKIQVYDMVGRLVEERSEEQEARIGKNLPAGIYFVKIKGHKPVKIIKLMEVL